MGLLTRNKHVGNAFHDADAAGDHYVVTDVFSLDQDLINGAWREGWALKETFQNNHSMGKGNQARGKYTLIFERMAA